jgi:hypothetical protein
MAFRCSLVRLIQTGDAIFVEEDGQPRFYLSVEDGSYLFKDPAPGDGGTTLVADYSPVGAVAVAVAARIAAYQKSVAYDWTTMGDRRSGARGRRSTD